MKLPLRILVLCTANSARSQITQALLRYHGGDRVFAESAGTIPADDVHPGALAVLEAHGIPAAGHRPKGVGEVFDLGWDLVLTVCDQAQEACPVFPGATLSGHWGVEDPAGAQNPDDAFEEAFLVLEDRVSRLLGLDLCGLASAALKAEIDRIGEEPSGWIGELIG